MPKEVKTIAVLTSGGDAPGMNAAVRAVVRAAIAQGMNVKGIRRGYAGLLAQDIFDMDAHSVSNILSLGGTMLLTARCREFLEPAGPVRASKILKDRCIDGLVVIGGDGSFAGAQKLAALGINTIGIPGTIDMDISSTDYTIGFDTAVNTAMDAIDKIRDTSASHERCAIIEVMGRSAGYLALMCGIAIGAEDILLPEIYDGNEQRIIDSVRNNFAKGKKLHLIVNAEGVGNSITLAKKIEDATEVETRATILGYLQRGGSPTCRDRFIASEMGVKAVDLLVAGKSNRVVSMKNDQIVDFDIDEALAMKKGIPLDWARTATLLVR